MNPTQTAKFRFGPVRQEVGSKHVRQGDLLEAINVRQTAKAGVYAKRKAFKRTAQTFVGGTLSGSPETVLPGTGGNSLMRDTGDQLWARSASTNAWNLMGNHPRPWPTVTTVQSNLYTVPQPFSCLVGSSLWMFALTTNAYEFSIVDPSSGVATTKKVTVAATGIVHASAAYDGTNVWVFWVDNGANGTIRCHKIVASTPTVAPALTNYYTFPSSPTNVSTVALQQVQARTFSSTGKIVVCACGGSLVGGTYKRAVAHSILDPVTGLASTVPAEAATVAYAYSGATGPHIIGGLYILDGQDGSGTYWYYVYVNWDTASSVRYQMVRVTANALPTFGTTTLGNTSLANATQFNCTGFVDNSTNAQYVIVTARANAAFTAWSVLPVQTTFVQVNAGVVTSPSAGATALDIINGWAATGFASVGGKWYVTVGYDDWSAFGSAIGAEGLSIQRAFFVYLFTPGASATESMFTVCAQSIMGNGPALWHRSSGAISWPSGTPPVSCTSPLWRLGNTLLSAIGVAGGASNFCDLALLSVDTAKTYGKSCQAMGYGFSPGSIPVVWSSSTSPHETAPLLGPDFAIVSGGTGSDFSIAAIVYAIYDNNGAVWRSFPRVISQTIGNGASIDVPSPTFKIPGTRILIEWYLGNGGTAKLQGAVVPTPIHTVFTTPTLANMVNGEILYTTGGALSQTWPQPCQAMGIWNNRLFLAQKNVLWTSKEMEPGFGPLFNEVQRSTWNEESNDITAIAPVDWNYLGIASEGQVAVISGPGPDGVGNGNYVIKTLPSYTGVAAGGVAIQGAQGMYYQNRGTGRIMCLQPSLQVMEAAGGAYDYASYNFSVAAWYESENLMVFFAPASEAAIAIDYQHPQEAVPFGQVYLWTFAAGFVPAAACRDDSGLLVISSQGGVYRTTTSQWVDDNASGTTDTYAMKLTTAELQMSDLQGGFNLKTLQALFSMRGASSVRITTYPGYASATGYDGRTVATWIALPAPTNSGDTETVMTKPENCMRIQSFRVSIEEMAGVTTQSFEFEGLGVEYSTAGRLLRPTSGRVI